jgi:membrane protein YqaA with SNARE-associated domain
VLLLLPDFTEWATDIIDRLGYPGVGALVALENVIPPIPSEVILPLAGFQADQGDFNLFLLILVATVGSIVGALILYTVGAVLGEHRIRRLVARFGRYVLVTTDDMTRRPAGSSGTAGARSSSAGWCRWCGAWSPSRPGSTRCRSGRS